MNNISKEKPIERVSASHTIKRNSAHERTSSSLLSPQQNAQKNQKGFQKYPLPPQLLRLLVAKLVSLLQGSHHRYTAKNPQRESPFKKQ